MTFITTLKAEHDMNLKNSFQKTIDGRSRKAIMSIALKLSGKPRIVDWLLAKPVKNAWQ